MSETLFDLTRDGDIAPPRPPAPTWPCGVHELYRGDYAHVVECWGLVCPDCGHALDNQSGDPMRDALAFTAVHGSPSGYRSGYCYMQRNAWERVAECIACRSWWFAGQGCHNRTCRLFVSDEGWHAQRDWERYFYEGVAA